MKKCYSGVMRWQTRASGVEHLVESQAEQPLNLFETYLDRWMHFGAGPEAFAKTKIRRQPLSDAQDKPEE